MAKDSSPKMKKTEAVKLALEAGKEKPIDGVNWIKEQFDIDITPQMFSSYKSKASEGEKKASSSHAVKVASSSGAVKIPSSSNAKLGGDNGIELARQVKALVEMYGASAVRDMADVFAS